MPNELRPDKNKQFFRSDFKNSMFEKFWNETLEFCDNLTYDHDVKISSNRAFVLPNLEIFPYKFFNQKKFNKSCARKQVDVCLKILPEKLLKEDLDARQAVLSMVSALVSVEWLIKSNKNNPNLPSGFLENISRWMFPGLQSLIKEAHSKRLELRRSAFDQKVLRNDHVKSLINGSIFSEALFSREGVRALRMELLGVLLCLSF